MQIDRSEAIEGMQVIPLLIPGCRESYSRLQPFQMAGLFVRLREASSGVKGSNFSDKGEKS